MWKHRSSAGGVRPEHLEPGGSQPRAPRSSPAAWCFAHQSFKTVLLQEGRTSRAFLHTGSLELFCFEDLKQCPWPDPCWAVQKPHPGLLSKSAAFGSSLCTLEPAEPEEKLVFAPACASNLMSLHLGGCYPGLRYTKKLCCR